MWAIPKYKESMQRFKETGDTRYICQNELGKARFHHDMAYRSHEDLTIRTASEKVLCDKAFEIASNQQYDGYQRGLASVAYNFLIKNLVGIE